MKQIDKGIRASNYLVDLMVIYPVWFVFILFIGNAKYDMISLFFLMGLYYCVFEYFFNQTLGKMVTNTKVVMKNGEKPTLLAIFMRSVLRLFPLDALSYLCGTELGIHDLLSSTKLVKNT